MVDMLIKDSPAWPLRVWSLPAAVCPAVNQTVPLRYRFWHLAVSSSVRGSCLGRLCRQNHLGRAGAGQRGSCGFYMLFYSLSFFLRHLLQRSPGVCPLGVWNVNSAIVICTRKSGLTGAGLKKDVATLSWVGSSSKSTSCDWVAANATHPENVGKDEGLLSCGQPVTPAHTCRAGQRCHVLSHSRAGYFIHTRKWKKTR